MSQAARWIYLALLTWQWVWHLGLPQPWGNANALLAFGATLPLLPPLRGIWAGRHKPAVWGAWIVVLYFVVAVMEAWSNPPQRLAALVQLTLCTAYLGWVSAIGLGRRAR